MLSVFLVLTIIIFTLPQRTTIRSSIEIGSEVSGEQQAALEPPENVARRIASIYAPSALSKMTTNGISPSVLSGLENPAVESIGRSMVIVSTIDANFVTEAKEFHELLADIVIKSLAARTQSLRERLASRVALAKSASSDLENQIKDSISEIDRIKVLNEDLRDDVKRRRASLAALYERAATIQAGENLTIEAQIRELNEDISIQTELIGNLTLEHSAVSSDLARARFESDAQSRLLADAQLEQNGFKETHVVLPPFAIPSRTLSHRLSLLLVAFVISALAAFGTIVLLYNFSSTEK